MADRRLKPDWKAIEDRIRLDAFRGGMPPDRAGQEARTAVKAMKAKYLETGEMPEGWRGLTK